MIFTWKKFIKEPILIEVYVNSMGKHNNTRNLHVLPKGKYKVVALTRSPPAIPGTKHYSVDIRQLFTQKKCG